MPSPDCRGHRARRWLLMWSLCVAVFITAMPAGAAITLRGATQNGIDTVPPSGISYVGAGTAASRDTCGSINPAIPAGTNGDILISVVIAKESSATVSMGGWNSYYAATYPAPGNNNQELQAFIFWRIADGSGQNTVTQGGTCDNMAAQIARFSGVDTANPFETGSPGVVAQDSDNIDTGTITTGSATAMALVAGYISDNRTVTPGGGWNPSFNFELDPGGAKGDLGLSLHYQAQSTAGNKSISNWDLSGGGTDENFGVILALTPAASTAGLTINVPAGTTTDDVMVAAISVRPVGITITPPAGWTSLNRVDQAGGNSSVQEIFYRVATGSEPASYTWAFSGAIGGAGGGILSYSGVDTASPIDAFGGNTTANGTTHTANSITTSAADAMLISSHSFASAETWTPPAGMTEQVDVASIAVPQAGGVALEMNDQTQAVAGATGNQTATAAGNADTGVAQLIALTPAAATPGVCDFNSGLASGLPGEYFNNMTLTDPAAGTRVDGPVDFNWGTGSPGVAGVGTDQFSVRWEGVLRVTSTDTYRFQTVSDDGVRLWVNGNLVIDNWTDHAPTTDTSGDVALSAGQIYDIRLEYYENGGGSEIRLRWGRASGGFSYTPIPAGPEPSYGEGLYYCAGVSAPAPQAEWRMDEPNWDGTAGEVTDETGNGFDGTAQNGADTDDANPAVAGSPGTCGYGDFDGVDDYVEVSGLSTILNDTASLAFWINTTQIGSDTGWQAPGVTGVELGGGGDDIFWGWLDASGNIGISVANDFTSKSSTSVNDGSWHHVVLTRDAATGEYKIYIDGSLDASGTIAAGTIGTAFSSIGRIEDTGGSPEYFDGLLDEVRIYDAVLSDAEVIAIRDATHPCPAVGARMEVDSVTLNDTTSTPSFTQVTFNQTYTAVPLVFVLPSNEGPDPASIRIRNVTTTGFQVAQVEPANLDGPHPAMTVDYLAIEPGTLTLPDGRVLEAGSVATTEVQHGSGVPGGEGWEIVSFSTAFSGTPAVLAQVQGMNNESNNPPATTSIPWLVTAMQNVTGGGVELALERAEVDDSGASLGTDETIGYLAVEGNIQGSFVSGGTTILYESIVSADNITGWDNNNCAGNNGVTVNFVNTYAAPPLVMGSQNRHDGGDGGWVRRCGPVAVDQVRLAIDEDQFNDSERNHTAEAAGLLVFSEAFCIPNCAIAILDYYEINHNGIGVTCLSESITITAIDTDGNSVDPGNVTLDLSVSPVSGDATAPPAKGDWVRVSTGTGTLSNMASDGTADYTFPGDGTSSVTLVFNYTRFETGNTSETINFNVDDVTNGVTDTRDGAPATDPDLGFALTGFQFYNETDGSSTVPTQIAGKPSGTAPNGADITLRAVRVSDDDPSVCEPAFPAGATVSVPLGAECQTPGTCAGRQVQVTNNSATTAIATNDDNGAAATTAYTPVGLLFEDDGSGLPRAVLDLAYFDAGRIQLHANYEIPLDQGGTPPTGAGSGGFMTGSTNAYVVRPFGLGIGAIQDSGGGANPGADTPAGGLFVTAGTDFQVTVSAYVWAAADDDGSGCDLSADPGCTAADGVPDTNADLGNNNGGGPNALTPNFQGAGAEDVSLAPVAPYAPAASIGGMLGQLLDSVTSVLPVLDAASFSGGSDTLTSVNYKEVGSITLQAQVSDYLATGQAVSGRSSNLASNPSNGAVGRFGADRFTFTANTPELGPACGNFTYVDQPFDYTTAPQITARATAADGSTILTNYEDFTGSGGANWWLLNRAPDTSGGGVDIDYTDLAAPADIFLDTSVSTYTPNSGITGTNGQQLFALAGPFAYAKGMPPVSEQPPFNGDLGLDLVVTDADGASGTYFISPITFNNPGQRWGRLSITNASGSELLALSVPLRTEYWDGAAFVLNSDDDCTVIEDLGADIVLGNPDTAGGSPQAGDSSMVINDGTTQITSGAPVFSVGQDDIVFSAPADGDATADTGFVDIEINLSIDTGSGGSDDPWLQFDWDGDGAYDNNPTGRVTFGIYRGTRDVIYIREPWN